MRSVSGILHTGGTILGTSRTNPFRKDNKGDPEKILENIKKTKPARACSHRRRRHPGRSVQAV